MMSSHDTKTYELWIAALLEQIEIARRDLAAEIPFDCYHQSAPFLIEAAFQARCRESAVTAPISYGGFLYSPDAIFDSRARLVNPQPLSVQ